MTEPTPAEQRFNIELPPEVVAGHYADFAAIWHSKDIFVLDFAVNAQPPSLAEDEDTGQKFVAMAAKVVTRVRIPPSQVFEFMKALEKQLTAWEQEQKPEASG